jgi:2-polyprenyl-6-methoxyphenol hydroxylase-like FAD-dependent oxidoreductase
MKTYAVIISGAGPVGLFLACELALAKCSVLILEKADSPHSPLKQMPFGIRGLSAPSVEALHRRGLLDQLEVPKRVKNPFGHVAAVQAGHFAGIPFFYDDIDMSQWPNRLPSSTPTSLLSEMAETESVLTRRAEMLGVEIRRGLAVTGVDQTEYGVTARAGDQAFRGLWLVGCDGSRSVVRKANGFEFAGTEPEFTGYTVKVDIADPGKLKAGRNVTPEGMYFQSQPGYLAMQDFDGGAFHKTGEPVTLERVQLVLRRISGSDVTLTKLHVGTTWTDRARQATSYRQGRLLLAGDAAHIHSPLGGQGLNLGLGDAMNLGWKLASTIRGQAPDGLLDTYQAERHPVGEKVLDWSRAQVALMRPDPEARALHAIFSDMMKTRDGATYIAGRVWGIASNSAPNFAFEDGTTLGDLMHDGQGMLLDFDTSAALEAWANEAAIKYVAGTPGERLGFGALLIRPDGVVAWSSREGASDGVGFDELRHAAAHWFNGARRAS